MSSRGVNKVMLVGFLGQDPEVRYMPNGTAVANLSLATSESWNDKQTGERKELTEWHRVVIFGKLAEIAGEYLRKGSQVYIEGSLRTRNWVDDKNQTRTTTEILVKQNGSMQMLGSANRENSNSQPQKNAGANQGQQQSRPQQQQQQYSGQAQQPQQPQSGTDNMDFDDDIPF